MRTTLLLTLSNVFMTFFMFRTPLSQAT